MNTPVNHFDFRDSRPSGRHYEWLIPLLVIGSWAIVFLVGAAVVRVEALIFHRPILVQLAQQARAD